MDRKKVLELAEILWNYHKMDMPLEPADCILVLGSHDLRVGEYGARLYLQGLAPWLLLSGGLGNLTKGMWDEPEADKFARIAVQMGVRQERILIENRSTNTGENIAFSRALLEEKDIAAESFLVVQKPYMERRSYATFRKVWPGVTVRVASPPISFREYPTEEIPLDTVINVMVGDLQRIMRYPARGFQISQDVPEEVTAAFEALVAAGYDRHLIREE